MNTEAALLKSIEANLADPTPILVLADWLEEQGNDRLAHAWRWMARRGYRPGKRARRLAHPVGMVERQQSRDGVSPRGPHRHTQSSRGSTAGPALPRHGLERTSTISRDCAQLCRGRLGVQRPDRQSCLSI
jgi:uncharacterized protein (TIGR02996 family)